jgi:hypothetical protein
MKRRAVATFVGTLLTGVLPARAQQIPMRTEATRAGLRSTLSGFYFSLAHHDWNTLSQSILPAKIIANRHFPKALVRASPGGNPPACTVDAAHVDLATITLVGDWAEVSVLRCAQTAHGTDEFRFIHYQGRWWIVYIDLWSASSS